MEYNKRFGLQHWLPMALLIVISLTLAACDGHGNDTDEETNQPPDPPTGTGKLLISHPDPTKAAIALSAIPYTTAAATKTLQQRQTGSTTSSGEFQYGEAETVSFTFLDTTFAAIPSQAILTEDDLAVAFCRHADAPVKCQYAAAKNIQRLLLSSDEDENLSNGIRLLPDLQQAPPPIALDSAIDVFETALRRELGALDRDVLELYQPSLGINLEAPQPEADEVGGQAVPFVDLFRISRPFPEYSCTDIEYDEHGWPLKIPASCDTQDHPVLRVPSWATSLMLRYVPYGALPTGKYTVLYEGQGELQYSGIARPLPAESTTGRDIIEITPELIRERNAAGLRLQLKNINANDPVRNIRIVMPGGICAGRPFVRVDNASQCAGGQYRSFVDTLAQDRNAIVFNPDYLRFLKDFKVIRTMNFMEASPRNPCYDLKDEAYTECLLQPFEWSMRAKMDDASWGGSARTPLLERYARGVPLEVTVELANQIQRDPWFNIPHNATEDYITRYAKYVRDHLDPQLKAYIEYSNEPWNGIFWAALYVREKGKDLDSNPYRAGYKYYAGRAVEIFQRWHEIFGGADRLIRVLNTYHPDEWMTRNMLNEQGNHQFVDAVASAPYFHGCWDRQANVVCADEDKIPLVMKDVTSVDDIFAVIDNDQDPYGIHQISLINTQKQVAAVEEYDVDLLTYEGGQHLTVHWGDTDLDYERKQHLLDLFQAANRDRRMAGRYSQLLLNWKKAGGQLFTLYTQPQSYHKFGSFGIKEHLNQARSAAPKYDQSMQFQEAQGQCWWENC